MATATLGACGGDAEPPDGGGRSGDEREVIAVIERFERATARRDFKTICQELITGAVRRQAGGDECAEVLRRSAGELRDPRIEVDKVTFRRGRASVQVSTSAAGEKEAKDRVQLVREGGSFRISVLGR